VGGGNKEKKMATIQTFSRGVKDLKFSLWTAENTWGAAYDVLGVRGANLQWVVETDELRGDDVVLDRFTSLVSATLTINEASVDLTVFNMMLGGILTTTANYYDFYVSSALAVPYLGIAGRVSGSGGRDTHFLLPKAALAGNLQLNAQVDSYMIPQADFQGVNEGTINGMLRLRQYLVPTALTIPLATTGGGG
jgi:hypothetical protein